jgi:hypothetical protein
VINGKGNHNKNTLKMKRDSFKMLLMKVNTQYSDQIYKYLIAFENHMKKYAMYQTECQLYQKELQLKNKDQENTPLKALTDLPTLDTYRKNALTINKQKRTVYVFTSKRYASLDLYKIGISFCPKKRKNGINTTHVLPDDEFYEVHSVECYDADLVEKYVHDSLDQYRYRKEREFFLLPLPLMKTVIDNVASLFNDCYERINDAIEKWNYSTEIVVINSNDTKHEVSNNNVPCTDIVHVTQTVNESNTITPLNTVTPMNIMTPINTLTLSTNTSTHSLKTQLQNFCNSTGLSIDTIKHIWNLVCITEKMQSYPELNGIENIENIENYGYDILRILAKCYGIQNTHSLNKTKLVEKIRSINTMLS